MKVVATREYMYGSPLRTVKAGQEFEATAKDAEILVIVGSARYADKALKTIEPLSARKQGRDKGKATYQRRDLVAEDPLS